MAVIKVRTPSGVQQVRIEGEDPTEREQRAIIAQFFPEQYQQMNQATQVDMPTVPEVNLADATVEEIEQLR